MHGLLLLVLKFGLVIKQFSIITFGMSSLTQEFCLENTCFISFCLIKHR